MSKITNTTWGVPPKKNTIKKDLENLLDKSATKITITHIKKGFTDNVFKIETSYGTYILKEFTESWHLREAEIYKSVLENDPLLCAPKLIGLCENRLYIDFFNHRAYKPFQKDHMDILFKWVLAKHTRYANSRHTNLTESNEVKHHYLIEKPLKTFKNIIKTDIYVNKDIFNEILSKKSLIESLFNKSTDFTTLEHGDLEIQNLFYNMETNTIGVVDWTNSKLADGLTDFNQFIENCKICEINTNSYYEKFLRHSDIKDCEFHIKRNRFFMLLNKLNYYIGKFNDGIEFSESNGLKIHSLIEQNLLELDYLSSDIL